MEHDWLISFRQNGTRQRAGKVDCPFEKKPQARLRCTGWLSVHCDWVCHGPAFASRCCRRSSRRFSLAVASAVLHGVLDGSSVNAMDSKRDASDQSLASNAAFARSHCCVPEEVSFESESSGTNQTNEPQCGHVASSDGRDGSMRKSLPQTPQRL